MSRARVESYRSIPKIALACIPRPSRSSGSLPRARNVLETRGVTVRVLPPELTDLQRQVLQLMKIPASAFTAQS